MMALEFVVKLHEVDLDKDSLRIIAQVCLLQYSKVEID